MTDQAMTRYLIKSTSNDNRRMSFELKAKTPEDVWKLASRTFGYSPSDEMPDTITIQELPPPPPPKFIALLGYGDDEAGWGTTVRRAIDHALAYDGDSLVYDGSKVPVHLAIPYDPEQHATKTRYIWSKFLDGDGSSWVAGDLVETITISKTTTIDY